MPTTTLDVLIGQAVRIHHRGQLVGTANRHGRGWSVVVRGQQYEAATLDGLLIKVAVLPDHHRDAR